MAKNDFQYGGWNYYYTLWHVTCGFGIMTVNSPSGSTLQYDTWLWDACHVICPNVRYTGILHLVSILTISPQSTCHSAPVCEILSKSDHPQQTKMASCWFSRWWISAILDFIDAKMGFLCMTSYRSSTETIALNCLVFEKIVCFCILATDGRTDRQTNRWTAPMH